MSNTASGFRAAQIVPYSVRPLPVPNTLTAPYRPWIRLTDSMTHALGEALGALPRVTPAYEGHSRLAPWESRMLGNAGHRGYAREVVLSVAGCPVLSARTVSRLNDPALEVIRKLGDRPLAQLLFEDPAWVRNSPPVPLIEVATRRIGRACLWQTLRRPGQGRRQSRILVTELFERPV